MARQQRFQEILDILGPRIVNKEIDAGQSLTLADLEKEFSCSRTVAREVQRGLELRGLVKAQRRVGMVVQDQEFWNVFDPAVIQWRINGPYSDQQLESLTTLRLAIEPHAVESAARFASKEQREEILAAGRRVIELGYRDSGPEFMEADIHFHKLLLQYSGNEMFAALAPVIEAVLTWRTKLGLMPPRPERRAMKDHEIIAWSIYQGDGAKAAMAMRDLVDEVQEAFASSEPYRLRNTKPTYLDNEDFA